MTFEQLLAQLPEGFDKQSDAEATKTLVAFMKGAYTAKKADEAKEAVRSEYEAKRKEIQDKANVELEKVQKEYGERLA